MVLEVLIRAKLKGDKLYEETSINVYTEVLNAVTTNEIQKRNLRKQFKSESYEPLPHMIVRLR